MNPGLGLERCLDPKCSQFSGSPWPAVGFIMFKITIKVLALLEL